MWYSAGRRPCLYKSLLSHNAKKRVVNASDAPTILHSQRFSERTRASGGRSSPWIRAENDCNVVRTQHRSIQPISNIISQIYMYNNNTLHIEHNPIDNRTNISTTNPYKYLHITRKHHTILQTCTAHKHIHHRNQVIALRQYKHIHANTQTLVESSIPAQRHSNFNSNSGSNPTPAKLLHHHIQSTLTHRPAHSASMRTGKQDSIIPLRTHTLLIDKKHRPISSAHLKMTCMLRAIPRGRPNLSYYLRRLTLQDKLNLHSYTHNTRIRSIASHHLSALGQNLQTHFKINFAIRTYYSYQANLPSPHDACPSIHTNRTTSPQRESNHHLSLNLKILTISPNLICQPYQPNHANPSSC